jgi:uncharacterized phiE125 gp8 family phage protein
MAAYKITKIATSEPITLATVKQFLRVDFEQEDNLISQLIRSARSYLEMRTNTELTNTTVEQHLDSFPIVNPMIQYSFSLPIQIPISANCVIPLYTPVSAFTSIQYRDTNEAWQTLDSSKYVVDITEGRVQIINSPQTSQYIDCIKITYTVGGISEELKAALLMIVNDWYEHRSANGDKLEVHPSIERIIWGNRDVSMA